ncbi:Aste57867_3981 [Aphanomyces stellatus]|uniref:Aste57867_3981 protein n=1 Tax=Aphanomyces stellatus TaxID=120398 RepID=A0A485KEM6_9STRA|nr:hypothetical protein As57867_003970 [Aphanomyces stellatus]VFT81118.1 Aste57867_3981 [Aphanomyces stellatus]
MVKATKEPKYVDDLEKWRNRERYEVPVAEAMAVKASMGLMVKEFISRSSSVTRDIDALQDGYKLVTSKPNSRVYTRRAAHPSLKECLTIGRTGDLSLDDLAYLMYSDTTEVLRHDQAIFYEHNFHDAAVLVNFHSRTAEDPFLFFGVKYYRISIPSSGLSEVRDTLYFEYCGSTTDANGNKVLYVVRDSEFLQNMAPLPGVIRLQFRSLHLFTELPDGSVEIVTRQFINPHGMIPAWMCNRQLVRYASMVETYPTALQYKRFLDKVNKQPVRRPRKIVNICNSCNAKMTKFSFKALYNCAYCGEIVCSKCLVAVPHAIDSSIPPACVKEEYCKRCFLEAQVSTRGSMSAGSRGSGDFLKGPFRSDAEATHSVTSSTQDDQLESYMSTGNTIVKTEVLVPATPSRDAMLVDSATAAFSQLQLSIEQQKQLVSQMQEQLKKRSQLP